MTLQSLKGFIDRNGRKEHDVRWNRDVVRLPGHFFVLSKNEFKNFRDLPLLEKYNDDLKRMEPSINWCADQANKDPQSRRLLALNTDDYTHIFQCFNLVQFINTKDRNYDMYVYQRSQDLAKWADDIRCFLQVVDMFEVSTLAKVTKIVVIYGDIHYSTTEE